MKTRPAEEAPCSGSPNDVLDGRDYTRWNWSETTVRGGRCVYVGGTGSAAQDFMVIKPSTPDPGMFSPAHPLLHLPPTFEGDQTLS